MTIFSTRENWLLDAPKLDDRETLFIQQRGDLTQAAALAALDVQYGKGAFDAWQHGPALRVSRKSFGFHGATYARLSEASEYFWAARKENLPKEEIDQRREAIKEPKAIWEKSRGR